MLPFRIALCFCIGVLYCTPIWGGDLPDLGNSTEALLTPAEERQLGLGIIQKLQKERYLLDDPIILEYLQSLGHRLSATQSAPYAQPHPYQFFLARDRSVNAFATPGGFIVINLGVLLTTETESELAAVLAHEIAHITQRHASRMLAHQKRSTLPALAGILASALIAPHQAAAATGLCLTTWLSQLDRALHYSREHEKEADSVGMQSLSKAGFDPTAMLQISRRFSQQMHYQYDNKAPEFTMTHPFPDTRWMLSKSQAETWAYKQVSDSLTYHLVQARALLLTQSSEKACRYFQELLSRHTYTHRIGALYGYTLALLATNAPHQAAAPLQELSTTYPDHPWIQLAQAQKEMLEGHSQAAEKRLEETLKNYPSNLPVAFAYGQWLLTTSQTQKAIVFFQNRVRQSRSHPQFWTFLSEAYTQAKQPSKSHWAQAQYLKHREEISAAITQLRLAQKGASSQDKISLQDEIDSLSQRLKNAPKAGRHSPNQVIHKICG